MDAIHVDLINAHIIAGWGGGWWRRVAEVGWLLSTAYFSRPAGPQIFRYSKIDNTIQWIAPIVFLVCWLQLVNYF